MSEKPDGDGLYIDNFLLLTGEPEETEEESEPEKDN